jgi:4a-hydroxytetrahydrobiopterin dehydratase
MDVIDRWVQTHAQTEMEVAMPQLLDAALVGDALSRLRGWRGDVHGISRTMVLTDGQHRDFIERLKVTSDAMDHKPDILRVGGVTMVSLVTHSVGGVTEYDIAMASRITDLHRVVTAHPDEQPTEVN